ncbi:DNA helicase [Elysia marginata]|uniref:DNA helicase n=1 Tax=Elysia marginata TaxID=1093978 RepID=A0AAV4EMB3_9GAST|nr:DNA helicase [Elysia marginata]
MARLESKSLPPPPSQLMKYYDGYPFLKEIRIYNNALALASIGCHEHFQTGFNPTFTIQGKLYHRIGNLLQKRGAVPKFSQIYFYDSDAQLDYRLLQSGLDPQILKDFQTTLHSVKTYIQSFKTAIEVSAEQSDVKIVSHAEKKTPQNGHVWSYNLRTSSEIAALLPGDSTKNLDIILRCREGDVLCPTNSEIDAINKTIMEAFTGEENVYRSHDSAEEKEHQYPVEFLNTLCPSGKPPRRSHLKKHNIIMCCGI